MHIREISTQSRALHLRQGILNVDKAKANPISPFLLSYLDLETSGTSASTGLLKLATLRLNLRFLVLVWSETEVLDGLSGIFGSSEQQGVASSGCLQSQLIQSQDFSTSSKDASPSCSGESESCNGELGDSQETVVISDCANDHNDLVIGLLGCVGDNSRDGDRGSVDAGHEKSAENDLIEG